MAWVSHTPDHHGIGAYVEASDVDASISRNPPVLIWTVTSPPFARITLAYLVTDDTMVLAHPALAPDEITDVLLVLEDFANGALMPNWNRARLRGFVCGDRVLAMEKLVRLSSKYDGRITATAGPLAEAWSRRTSTRTGSRIWTSCSAWAPTSCGPAPVRW